jgi:hypothetical protein
MSQSQRQVSWRQGPSGPPRAYRESSNRHRNDLVMVDSMALQTVKIAGSNKAPGLSVHSDSSGGGRQLNIYTKLAEAKSTICFKVDSQDAALQAYRQVRDMNPSAPVGGVMFSVAPKADTQFVDVKNVDWSSMVAPRSEESPDSWSDLEEALFQALRKLLYPMCPSDSLTGGSQLPNAPIKTQSRLPPRIPSPFTVLVPCWDPFLLRVPGSSTVLVPCLGPFPLRTPSPSAVLVPCLGFLRSAHVEIIETSISTAPKVTQWSCLRGCMHCLSCFWSKRWCST